MKSPELTYAALIRGIMPTNPNTRNEKLKKLFEDLGFTSVLPIISSGNVVFKSKITDTVLLESKIEKAMATTLKFNNIVIVRSQSYLEKLIKKDPFKRKVHSRTSYLTVTFMKKKPWETFTVLDVTKTTGPSFMTKLEKEYSKVITTRTWKTVNRILDKMNSL